MFSLPSLSLVAVGLSGAVLLVLLLVLHQLQLLSGPAVRGKHHAWKKDEDPALVSDSSPLLVALDKVQFTLLSMLSRRISPVLFPPPLTDLNFYSVEEHPGVSGLVAVTIDDCFCRQNDPKRSLMPPVRAMIKKSGHRVTFFTTLQYAKGEWREKEIREFMKDGHELGNHCKDDREYDNEDVEVFASDLDETSSFIKKMCGSAPKWFRAPSGKISPGMSAELKKRDMLHVMLDGYANDPHIPDARFIASTMLRAATDGSVLIIHMPESGFREWCFEAIDLLLKGLKAKGLKSVTLSELKEAAEGKKTK